MSRKKSRLSDGGDTFSSFAKARNFSLWFAFRRVAPHRFCIPQPRRIEHSLIVTQGVADFGRFHPPERAGA
jgi:hypothetical protein